MKTQTKRAPGQMWYATHAGVDYAYLTCACDYRGSTVSSATPAPAGMLIAGGQGAKVPESGLSLYTCPECVRRKEPSE